MSGERSQIRRWPVPPWWDAAVAVGVFAFGCLLYAIGLALLDPARGAAVPLGARLALLALACAGQLMRARRPLLALGIALPAVAADMAVGQTIPLVLVLVDLLYCASLHGSRRTSHGLLAAAAVLTAAGAVAIAVAERDPRLVLVMGLQFAGLLLVPTGWGYEVRRHWMAAQAERAHSAQLARLAELDRRAAVHAERARMARDLHDVVAGHLSAIALQSEAALSLADGDPARARTVLRSVRENSLQSLAEMRSMIGLLRAPEDGQAPDPPPAPAGLGGLGRLLESASAGGLQVTADLPHPPPPLPAAVGQAAYRIVQEALTNAVKHAAGTATHVAVRLDGDTLAVEVVNDLAAPPAPETGGTGLVSMRERATVLGGVLAAGPDGPRWRVRAELPAGAP